MANDWIVTLLDSVAALSSLASGYFWFKSAVSEVKAPAETSGVGALTGGYLVTKNEKGQRIDLHATLLAQTYWNTRAAFAAASSAGLAVLALGAQIFHH